jgi:hypothetical protein
VSLSLFCAIFITLDFSFLRDISYVLEHQNVFRVIVMTTVILQDIYVIYYLISKKEEHRIFLVLTGITIHVAGFCMLNTDFATYWHNFGTVLCILGYILIYTQIVSFCSHSLLKKALVCLYVISAMFMCVFVVLYYIMDHRLGVLFEWLSVIFFYSGNVFLFSHLQSISA